jgi:hypothetical protein
MSAQGRCAAWARPLIETKSYDIVIGPVGGAPQRGLPIVPTAANRAPHGSQDPQDGADDQQDDPKRLKDPDPGEVAKEQQEQTENQHATASSAPHHHARCAEAPGAARTLIGPTPTCQSNLAGRASPAHRGPAAVATY